MIGQFKLTRMTVIWLTSQKRKQGKTRRGKKEGYYLTVLLYGCESWVLAANVENKINASATCCYRIMLNIKRLDCVSNARIHEMTNTQNRTNTLRQCQLCFLGHILRMPDDKPYRGYALYVLTHGRKRPGWQRKSYILYIRKLLGDTENNLHSNAIALLASDHCSWRKFVVACSAAKWWWSIKLKILLFS